MNQNAMIQSLRAEIAKLQRVVDLLLDQPTGEVEPRSVGRPKASNKGTGSPKAEDFSPKKRTMSAEGKARIAAAQKKRWAAQKVGVSGRGLPKEAGAAKSLPKKVKRQPAKKLSPAARKTNSRAGKKTGTARAQIASAKRSTKQTKTSHAPEAILDII